MRMDDDLVHCWRDSIGDEEAVALVDSSGGRSEAGWWDWGLAAESRPGDSTYRWRAARLNSQGESVDHVARAGLWIS